MIISDLDYLEFANENLDILGGDAAVAINVEGKAEGNFTSTSAITYAYSNPYVGVGVGVVVAVAVSPYSPDEQKSWGNWQS